MKHKKACNEAKLISDPPAGSRLFTGRDEELGRAVGAPLGTGTMGTRLWLLARWLCAGLAFQQGRAHSKNCLL